MVNIHRIKTLIKLKGMKIGHVCAQLGLTHTYFSNVESGKTTMSDERIHKVAEILGTTYEYLTDQTGDPRLPEEIEAEQKRKEFMQTRDGFAEMVSKILSANVSLENMEGMLFDIPKLPKMPPEEWGLYQKTSEEVAEEAEAMRIQRRNAMLAEAAEAAELFIKLSAEDKKTVLDLMRRLAGK